MLVLVPKDIRESAVVHQAHTPAYCNWHLGNTEQSLHMLAMPSSVPQCIGVHAQAVTGQTLCIQGLIP